MSGSLAPTAGRASDGEDTSSGSEFECESGSERMMYRSGEPGARALPTMSCTSGSTDGGATIPYSQLQWPKRLVAAKNGLGDARLACVGDPHYYMFLDVETSGSIWGVHMPIAVACAVLCVMMHEHHWEVRIMETHLSCYSQRGVIFEPGILDPGGFWHRHHDVLKTLDAIAQQHALTNAQVTAGLAHWWDDAMMRYDYPHIWSDNPVFDAGQVSLLFGAHLARPGLAFVRHPQFISEYIYARPPQHTNTVCIDLIHPCMTHMQDPDGAPSFMNHALKHQALGKIAALTYDHNPRNDVQRIAVNFGRLLCRWIERRTLAPRRMGLDILCYLQGGETPLATESARPVHYSSASRDVLDIGLRSMQKVTSDKHHARKPTSSTMSFASSPAPVATATPVPPTRRRYYRARDSDP